ncbi:hypothetical protein ACU686_06200 [Yinghuangia aomiensis]
MVASEFHPKDQLRTAALSWEPLAAKAREHVRGQDLGVPSAAGSPSRTTRAHDRHAAAVTARLEAAFDRRHAAGGEFRDEIPGASWGLRYHGDRGSSSSPRASTR